MEEMLSILAGTVACAGCWLVTTVLLAARMLKLGNAKDRDEAIKKGAQMAIFWPIVWAAVIICVPCAWLYRLAFDAIKASLPMTDSEREEIEKEVFPSE